MKASFSLRYLAFLPFFFTSPSAPASDFVKFKNGTLREGSISGSSKGNIQIQTSLEKGGKIEASFPITDISLLSMSPPPSWTDAKKRFSSSDLTSALPALTEIYNRFQPLPTDWIDIAAFDLIDLLLSTKKNSDAETLLANYRSKLSPQKTTIDLLAARLAFAKNQPDEAKKLLFPILDSAKLAPPSTLLQLAQTGQALYLMGQILETENQPSQALESYLLASSIYASDSLTSSRALTLASSLQKEKQTLVP